jgi:hypothetical protein
MHPMFVKLFIETDEDDLLAYEEDRRRRSRRARRQTLVGTTGRGAGSRLSASPGSGSASRPGRPA